MRSISDWNCLRLPQPSLRRSPRQALILSELSRQDAEKVFANVILSGTKNLVLRRINQLRDPSSPAAPRDDNLPIFFQQPARAQTGLAAGRD